MIDLPVTIIIPTHNRHQLLAKTLAYYDRFELPVLVVDSSSAAIPIAEGLKNVTYLHRPGEAWPHKLSVPVLERVRTPYLFMSADDSYTSLDAVRACVEFLEAHPDYSSAQGFYLGYWLRDGRLDLDVYYRSVETLDSVVDSHRAEDRLIQMFTRYSAMFYAVYRTDCQREMYARYPDIIRNYCIAEFYFAMMTAIHGKHALLPVFYQLQEHAPGIGHNEAFRNDMNRLATMERYVPEFDAFVEAVTAYLAEVSGRPAEEARIFVMKAVALQAWQRRMKKTVGDRLRAEWQNLLNKTVHKARKKELARTKRETEEAQCRRCVHNALEIVGENGRQALAATLKQLDLPMPTGLSLFF